jgi:hypothetical protein
LRNGKARAEHCHCQCHYSSNAIRGHGVPLLIFACKKLLADHCFTVCAAGLR